MTVRFRHLAGFLLLLLAAPMTLAANSDPAPTLPDWLSTFDGQIRVYEFQRFHDGNRNDPSIKSALGTSAKLFAQTKSLFGFSTGLGLYGASNFGLSPQPFRRDGSLMGNGDSFATPAEAFLQYHYGMFQARAGNQLLHTPWVWGSDSRVIPAAYQGLTASITPVKDLAIEAGYIERWKNRTQADFATQNLYGVNPPDFWYGGASYGLSFGAHSLKLQGWYYRFTDVANLTYVQANWRWHTGGALDPIAAVQFAHETEAGTDLLRSVDTLGRNRTVDARVWGAEAGVAVGPGTYTVAYDAVPSDASAFENGNIVTPYTHTYATDPLFTTSMTQGLADQTTSGHAWKAKGVYWLGGARTWRFIGSYARYSQAEYFKTDQTGNPYEADLDATYFFRSGPLEGFSVRDRVGVFSYSGQQATFVYNRLQFQYDF